MPSVLIIRAFITTKRKIAAPNPTELSAIIVAPNRPCILVNTTRSNNVIQGNTNATIRTAATVSQP